MQLRRRDAGHRATGRSARTAAGRSAAAAAGIETDRRSYPQVALTCNLGPQPPAPRHLDRIPHRGRSVHPGAAARPALEPGLGDATRPTPLASRPCPTTSCRPRSSGGRIRSWARSRSSRAAASFRWRSRPRAALRRRASCWSAKPPMSAADRRAGPQSRPARRRHHRRTGGRRPSRRPRRRR